MTNHSIAKALTAVLNREDYPVIKAHIAHLAGIPNAEFYGVMAQANPLVEFAREHGVPALAPLWGLADHKHRLVFPGSELDAEQAAKRKAAADYNRVHMERRRRLLSKATKIHYRLTGEAIFGTSKRKEFEGEMWELWMVWRDLLLDSTGKRGEGHTNALIKLFWEDIEARLDKALAGDQQVGRDVLGMKPGGG